MQRGGVRPNDIDSCRGDNHVTDVKRVDCSSKRHVDREQPSARLRHARRRLPRASRVDAGERDLGERRQSVHLVIE